MSNTIRLFLLVTVAIHAAVAQESAEDFRSVLLRSRRDADILGNTRKLVEQLVENLRKASEQASAAIGTFTSGLQNQVKLFREHIETNIQSLRDRVNQAIQNITDRFTNSGSAIRECVESHQKETDAMFNTTVTKTMACVDERVKEIGKKIEELSETSKAGIDFANEALQKLRTCTENNSGNIVSIGSCLGTVALQTEIKGASYLGQSGIQISRINLAIATLPASLEVCAGSNFFNAGIGSARIVFQIGQCASDSLYASMTG